MPNFKGMWTKTKKTALDYSRKTEQTYTLVPPFATDLDTGEVLNETAEPKLVKSDVIDIDEKIQSFKDDADIYKILERCAMSGDMSLVQRNVGTFADIVDIPDNIHDFYKMQESNVKKAVEKFGPEVAKGIVAGDSSIQDLVNAAVSAKIKEIEAAKAPTPATTQGGAVNG